MHAIVLSATAAEYRKMELRPRENAFFRTRKRTLMDYAPYMLNSLRVP